MQEKGNEDKDGAGIPVAQDATESSLTESVISLDEIEGLDDGIRLPREDFIIPFMFILRPPSPDTKLEGTYQLLGKAELEEILDGQQLVLISVDELVKIIDGLHASFYQLIGFMKAHGIADEQIWSMMDAGKDFLVELILRARQVEIHFRDEKIVIEETNPLILLSSRITRDWLGTDDWI